MVLVVGAGLEAAVGGADYFSILGLKPGATLQQIKKAFRSILSLVDG